MSGSCAIIQGFAEQKCLVKTLKALNRLRCKKLKRDEQSFKSCVIIEGFADCGAAQAMQQAASKNFEIF
jgi:hypothetical protein